MAAPAIMAAITVGTNPVTIRTTMPTSAATATQAREFSPANSLAIASGVPTTTKLRRSFCSLPIDSHVPRTRIESPNFNVKSRSTTALPLRRTANS